MGADATPPRPAASAAEIPRPAAAVPLETGADPWQDLRRRARDQRRWTELRWGKPLAAGCLALVCGGITGLVITGHTTQSVPPPTVKVTTPAVSAPPVASPTPVAVPPTPAPSVILPVPIVAAPSPSVDGTTEPRAAAVPPPHATTHRAKRPTSATPTAARPSPPRVAADGAEADGAGPPSAQAGPPCAGGCPEPTLTKTPTSWSPTAPQ